MSLLAPPPPRIVYPRVMPLPPSSPVHWTAAEFHRVRASGVWDGRRTYLIRGVIWEQGPMNPPHAACVNTVFKLLLRRTPQGMCVRGQLPLELGLDADPIPDVAVVHGDDDDYRSVHPDSAFLVVEVADTSVFEDEPTKAELYASGGVPEYWIVDVNACLLHVHRNPRPLAGAVAYRDVFTLTLADSVTPLAVPTAAIPVSELIR
jgi:Uma2 family endonuclease